MSTNVLPNQKSTKGITVKIKVEKEITPPKISCHQCGSQQGRILLCDNFFKAQDKCQGNYCEKCLNDFYGHSIEELEHSQVWRCFKCLDACCCSLCIFSRSHFSMVQNTIFGPSSKHTGNPLQSDFGQLDERHSSRKRSHDIKREDDVQSFRREGSNFTKEFLECDTATPKKKFRYEKEEDFSEQDNLEENSSASMEALVEDFRQLKREFEQVKNTILSNKPPPFFPPNPNAQAQAMGIVYVPVQVFLPSEEIKHNPPLFQFVNYSSPYTLYPRVHPPQF